MTPRRPSSSMNPSLKSQHRPYHTLLTVKGHQNKRTKRTTPLPAGTMVSRSTALVFMGIFAFCLADSSIRGMAGDAAYYVSSSDGADSNAGTSSTTPFRTLTRMSTEPLAANATTRIWLHAGDIFVSALTLHGTAGAQVVVSAYGASVRRPVIALNGAGRCIEVTAPLSSLSLSQLELRRAATGVWALNVQHVNVSDVVFGDVFNRSYVGQSLPSAGRCYNGWSPSVAVGPAVTVAVTNSVFSNIDVAYQPFAAVTGTVGFQDNTITGANGNTIFFTASHGWMLTGCVFTRNNAPRFFPSVVSVFCRPILLSYRNTS